MRTLLLIILLFSCGAIDAQESPFKYFEKENQAVRFVAVYDVDSLSKEKLKGQLLAFIPSVEGVVDVHENTEGITAVLKDYTFNSKAAGYKAMSTPIYLSYPMSGTLSVSIKEGKYRVIISNIVFVDYEPLRENMFYRNKIEDFALKSQGEEWITGKGKVESFKKLEEDFYRSFQIQKAVDNW